MKLVIAFVGVICVGSLASVTLLSALGRGVPDVLPTIAVAALTGLVGLLARPTDTVTKPLPNELDTDSRD